MVLKMMSHMRALRHFEEVLKSGSSDTPQDGGYMCFIRQAFTFSMNDNGGLAIYKHVFFPF